jgi:carboxypeptidase C (cathepsin A)
MKFKNSILILTIFHFIFASYLFLNLSLVPYLQLNTYLKYSLNKNTNQFIKNNLVLSNINTSAMVDICRDLMSKADLHSSIEKIYNIDENISLAETNIKNCSSKLLVRGESTDFAVLGKVYSYLYSLTNHIPYKEKAEYYIVYSKSLSPNREDLKRINSISSTYLSKFGSP